MLAARYYVDEIYQWVIDRIVLVFGRFIAAFDRVVVNDTAVDGSADSVKISSFRMKFVQTGRIYNYGMAMAAGCDSPVADLVDRPHVACSGQIHTCCCC